MDKEKLIILAADHNGVELKSHIHDYLSSKGYICVDMGPYTNENSVDYTDYAFQLGKIIDKGDAEKGILICGTGVGMSITANRFKNVRAALIHNLESAPKSREHNNSNVLCLGSWLTPPQRAEEIVDCWVKTQFGEGRHVRRVEKISDHKENTVVLANGVFDILHTGHIELIKFAKSLGDKLIVAINSDRSVRKLKGENRPINSEEDRKSILQSLKEIDEVVIFDDIKTRGIITAVMPDIVVKGSEYTAQEIRERDNLPDQIKIKIFPMIKDRSTTGTLKKIKDINTWKKK